ncbi:hypothetical protein pdam_00018075 [Pocillopora damicornis]|uniref:Uncharacterized protein n=1 Tax=Pocillopora damicornis TaxID=46731 RepID=A0A3M6V619_POCDA|nr:hypothetical protein pdam_00018075 [Pocillopora damicornis]
MRNFITWLRNKAARATILLEIRTNNGIWSLRPYWLEQETNYRVCIGMFIDLEGAITNFVSIHTLRDSGSVDIRRKLRKCLTLDCVRNKDRMAVESIVHLTRPAVLYVLEEVMFVVLHRSARKVSLLEIKSNQVKRPLYAKDSSPLNVELKARVIELRLHQPIDVEVPEGTFNDAIDLCFINERASSLIRFNDLEGKVIFKPGSLKYRADPLSQLACFILPLDGTGSVLRKRLNTHLQN